MKLGCLRWCCALLFWFTCILHANQTTDTLGVDALRLGYEEALKQQDYDRALIALNKLGDHLIYEVINHKESYSLFQDFNPYLKACKDPKEKAKYYINLAEAATYAQDFKGSLEVLEEGIALMERAQDSSLYAFGYAYLKAGENTNKLNRFTESARYFQKAEKLFTHQQDTLMFLWTKSGLSSLFSNYALYEKAAEERAYIFQNEAHQKYGQVLAIAHLGAASDAFFQDDQQTERYHIDQALKVNTGQADISEIVQMLTLAYATITYAKQGDPEQSNRYFAQLEAVLKDRNTETPFINSYYKLAQSQNALSNGRYQEAETYVRQQLVNLHKANDWKLLARAYLLLTAIYEAQQNNTKALDYYKDYVQLKDSVSKAASRKEFALVQTRFETVKKDLEIASSNQKIKLLQAQNRIVEQRFIFGGILIVVLFIVVYIWRSRLYAIKKIKLQKAFAKHLVAHLEQDRKRIAGELHDSIGQNLLLIKHKLHLQKEGNIQLIQQTIDEVRSLSQSLHPFQFEKLGLLNSISYTVENFQNHSAIFYSEEIQVKELHIEKEKALFIYRMIQECLTNVEKHSQAKACVVRVLETKTHYTFEVEDNGVGFDVTQCETSINSLGLKTLKERAQLLGAHLDIRARKGKGTLVNFKLLKQKL